MKANFFKNGKNVLLACKIEEIRNDETIRLRLLEGDNSGDMIHTLSENVYSVDLGQVKRIAVKAGYMGEISADNVKEIVKALAENHAGVLSHALQKMYKKAVDQFTGSEDTSKTWDELTNKADSILALLDIFTDYPGLYPTFELDRGGKHFCETSEDSALKQYNNFWGHW